MIGVRSRVCFVLGLGTVSACADGGLPRIPWVTGALQVDVVYPPDGALISVRDSNFILGNVGNGRARLTINGQPVAVEPNGAFLGWLPVSASVRDTVAAYELVASVAGDTVRVTHTVRLLLASTLLPSDRAIIDPVGVSPGGVWWVRKGELVPVRARASTGARVRLILPDGRSVPLTEASPADSLLAGTYAGAFVANPGKSTGAYLEVSTASDTAVAPLQLDLSILEEPGPWVELRKAAGGTGVGPVIGRPAPGAGLAWLWADGVRARVTGRRDGLVRIALDERTDAWVALDDVAWLPEPNLHSPAEVGDVWLNGLPDRLVVRIGLGAPVPYTVQVRGRRVSLILYGAFSGTHFLGYGRDDDFVQTAWWEQVTGDRYALHLDFARRPWGYRVRYESDTLVLEIRKPPPIDPKRLLSGLRVVVDAGHPPGGAVGPTRLYEGDVNLAVALRVKRRLEREGATVFLTRTGSASVLLSRRVQRAEALDGDVLISIHNNALADGVNPFENHGTTVYYFHPFAVDLARALQRSLLKSLGLRDLGIGRANFAMLRPTWLPSAISEGVFMMIPAHEAALRNPGFLDAYARALVEGLRAFMRGRVE